MRTSALRYSKEKMGLVRFSLSKIKPSPENDSLYSPINPAHPDIVSLAESIKARGILEPIVVTADTFIVSGHRRYAAAKVAGLTEIYCRVLPLKRSDNRDEFVRLLREHNRQREKTNAERLREEIVSASEEDAVAELWAYRREKAAVNVKPIELGLVRFRAEISDAKQEMLRAAVEVINSLKPYWPLSDRRIHYALLNDPPLRHSSKPLSRYKNDAQSYKDLTNLLTRARLTGDIPFAAIGDETRPVSTWDIHQTSRTFINQELDGMFRGYFRDLMQSQSNHIEIIGEKNTVLPTLRPVAMEYTIPITTGRGYCSLPPRYDMAERYFASGKEKLVVLCVSDFDPEGVDIAESFARSMRDDFGISKVHAVKAALTQEQVKRFKLPPDATAKTTSSRYKKFVQRYGKQVFELEALPPETLQQLLREHIEAVIDHDAFEAEIAVERKDARFLAGVRNTVNDALAAIDFEEDVE
jgi:hypothetical protein